MKRSNAPVLLFTQGEDPLAQRDAAVKILETLQAFFKTEDLVDIEDMIDGERLTNEDGLSENHAREIRGQLESLATRAQEAESLIERRMNTSW